MKWQEKSNFEKDFQMAVRRFPKLKHELNSQAKRWEIKGELDICDYEGNYWGTFRIKILVPQSYPYCVPIVIELTKLIPREEDWHISGNGVCCVAITHRLIKNARKGMTIESFISTVVYPYFANQLHKLIFKTYAGEEYEHEFKGVVQFYQQDLGLSPEQSYAFLGTLRKQGIRRNQLCPCGSSKKIKKCHLDTMEFLQSMGKARIKVDFEGFESILHPCTILVNKKKKLRKRSRII